MNAQDARALWSEVCGAPNPDRAHRGVYFAAGLRVELLPGCGAVWGTASDPVGGDPDEPALLWRDSARVRVSGLPASMNCLLGPFRREGRTRVAPRRLR